MTTTATFRGLPLREVRNRWNREGGADALLRVALLSTYTIDPLVPYLGTALRDAGLPAAVTVGPLNQVVQQCLDDTSETARTAPDVLVVAPRFEELAGDGDLTTLADVAGRWRACLVFVLPPLPDDRYTGLTSGWTSVTVRERVRRTLARRPGVHVADAESVVRTIGSQRAHHPSLYEYARIPYTEEAFAGIADVVSRLLRLRFGVPARAVVVDVDELRFDRAGDDLVPRLAALRAAGVCVALRSGQPSAPGPQWTELADDWVADDRPRAAQVAELAAANGLTMDEVILLTGATPADGLPALVLDGSAAAWEECMPATGLFDTIAGPVDAAESPEDGPAGLPGPSLPPSPGLSLDEYVAGLNVSVTWRPVAARFGTDADVELFLVSCPVLGKGVEAAALRRMRDLAADRGSSQLRFHCTDTGRNGPALDFLRAESGAAIHSGQSMILTVGVGSG